MAEIRLLKVDKEFYPLLLHREKFSVYKRELLQRERAASNRIRLLADLWSRKVLSEISSRSFEAIRFQVDELGKPGVADPDFPYHFNLSHSGDMIALMISEEPCGIDVEVLRQRRAEEKLVQRFFHSKEIETYHKYPEGADRSRYFFRIWTLKEAYLKAIGQGIRSSLNALYFADEDSRWQLYNAANPGIGSALQFRSVLFDDEGIALSYAFIEGIENIEIKTFYYSDIEEMILS